MAAPAPIIAGCLVVDISRHVDQHGFLTHRGTQHAWRVLADAPAGINVRLNIGGLRAITGHDLISALAEAGILGARRVDIEGTEPEGVEAVITALRSLRDARSDAA